MPDYGSRIGQTASGAASGAALGLGLTATGVGAPLGIPLAALGGGLGFLSGLFSESDSEIRRRKTQEYLKRRAELRDRSLARLSEETGKNVGRINAYTTGQIQQGQADIGARAASRGRGADEADFLAVQGQITEQGSEAIQKTQDAAERLQRQIQEQYEQDVMMAEAEGIFAPEDPGLVDVLGSVAPAALQFAMNKDYLNADGTANTGINSSIPTRPPEIIPTGIDSTEIPVAQDRVIDTSVTDYGFTNEAGNTNPYVRRRGLFNRGKRLPNTFYPSFAR